MGKNGSITLKTSRQTDQIVVKISDTGPGMTRETMAKIFDPFFTTKEVGKGTGLGLSLSYSIIEKLGGAITVDSEIGQGTTFTITLPIK
jgi:two-component system NtrC family sensor kinase